MLWLCMSVGISVVFHRLLLVISAAPYWTPFSGGRRHFHRHFKNSLQRRPNLKWNWTLVPLQPLSLPGNTCRLFILNKHAIALFWNNLQVLFFLFAVPLEANRSAFSCFLSLLRLSVKEGYSWCWNSRTNI